MNKVVLVTGGSSGIGLSICLYLHSKGCKVYGTSRNPEKYKDQFPFPFIALDVLNANSAQTAIQQLIQLEGRIDVLVNNAGIGMLGAIEDSLVDEAHEVFNTNVYGILRTVQAVLPTMRQQKAGLIINVSSIAGYMGLPYRGIYSASKASVHMITEALRMELVPYNIQACVVDPGDFATNINENRKVASPSKQGSVYQSEIERIENMINAEVAHAGNAEAVGVCIYKIMHTKMPKINYLVGKPMQKLSIMVRRLIPQTWFESIILNHYKMPKK
jgi:NAD(P)-dependent dehydrogenase (short-subunit alcohol dehydrogenase family)